MFKFYYFTFNINVKLINFFFSIEFSRSKSRSVDHGVSAPFDIEALRSKVEGRFESVDKLSRGILLFCEILQKQKN